MRQLLRIILHAFALSSSVFAQQIPKVVKEISDKELKEQAVKIANQFALIVKGLDSCLTRPATEKIEDIFAADAVIEVSSLRGKKVTHYSPAAYFRAISALRCRPSPVYSSMHFDYHPVGLRDAVVSRLDSQYTVSLLMKQTFTGASKKGDRLYSDLTVKLVTLSTKKDSSEIYRTKILCVFVEEAKTPFSGYAR